MIAIGSVGSLLGRANAVSKVLTDHAENVVIVSQCVNSGIISCADIETNNAGGIVGELQDRSIVRDCLNTASVIGSNGGGHMHPRCEVHNCLTIAEESSWENMISSHDVMYEDSNLYYCEEISTSVPNIYMSPSQKVQTRSISWVTGLSSSEIATASSFEGWDIGNQNNKWSIPSETLTYPIPFVSEYSLN